MLRPWKSWLIPGPEVVSEQLENSLRQSFNISLSEKLTARPAACLDLVDGQWTLFAENIDKFFADLEHRTKGSPDGILAMVFCPIEDLYKLVETRFYKNLKDYPVSWLGAYVTPNSDPYARRLIRISPFKKSVVSDAGETQISNKPGVGRYPIVLQPISVQLDHSAARNCARASEESDGKIWALPPTRLAEHQDREKSYFAQANIDARVAIRKIFDAEWPHANEPTAITANRLVDDPALRDLLIEGSMVQVEASHTAATQLVLEILQQPAERKIAVSRALLIDDKHAYVPAWAQPLAKEIARDIRHIIPGGFVRTANEAMDWMIGEFTPSGTLTKTGGDRQRLNGIAESVRAVSDGDNVILEEVLRPSSCGDQFDHRAAIRSFCKNFWRQTWRDNSDERTRSPWEAALGSLIRDMTFEPSESSEQRRHLACDVEHWASREMFDHIALGQSPMIIRYNRGADSDDLLHWRLVYPLGTVIQSGAIILDAGIRSRIDTGLVLA